MFQQTFLKLRIFDYSSNRWETFYLLANGCFVYIAHCHLWLLARNHMKKVSLYRKYENRRKSICRKEITTTSLWFGLPLGKIGAILCEEQSRVLASTQMNCKVLRFIKATTSIHMTFECHFTWLHYTELKHTIHSMSDQIFIFCSSHIYTHSFWHFISIFSFSHLHSFIHSHHIIEFSIKSPRNEREQTTELHSIGNLTFDIARFCSTQIIIAFAVVILSLLTVVCCLMIVFCCCCCYFLHCAARIVIRSTLPCLQRVGISDEIVVS